ncbi:hypothetical protein FGB62_25g146 [Gracilaria domingensis]|nr:hypothetical protein FGB62_25g146 [Gracilaria domingensis]
MSTDSGSGVAAKQEVDEHSERVASIRDAFRRIEPGETPPEAPESLRTWCTQTTYGVIGGMLFGGYRGLQQARNKNIPSPVPTSSAQHRVAVFFVRDSILTGSRVGVFVSLFSAAALLAGHSGFTKRVDHPANYAAAGAFTCGLFAAAVGGWTPAGPAAAFGAAISGAGAAAHQALEQVVSQNVARLGLVQAQEPEGSVSRVIKTVEENLAAHPLRTASRSNPVKSTENPQT